ncbi:hypothetical protein KAU33_04285 [Candidatus Dependentiae bacterium]|nr:hypothetical protein [Candidatus Dependentiae bacterium]
MKSNKSKLWDKKRHKWIKDYSISPNGAVLDGNLGYDAVHKTKTEIVWFTGRKDKSGAEIYEGDIIFNMKCFGCVCGYGTHTDNFPNIRIVVWDDDYNKYRLCHIEERIRDMEPSGSYLCKANECEFEIAGNIRENPELLENDME